MSYTGKVRNGVVVLDHGASLADGTIVRVEPVQPAEEASGHGHRALMKLAGVIKDKPSDWARNHDHYIHGQPKR